MGFSFNDCYPAYFSLVGVVVANIFYWVAAKRRGFPIGDFYLHWAVDLVLITIIIYGLGGSALPSSITPYILIVITSAVFISKQASYLVATGAVLSHSTLVAMEASGWLEPGWTIVAPFSEKGVHVFVLVAPMIMIYLVAYIAGASADQVATANRLLANGNRALVKQNTELDRLHQELDFHAKVLAHDIRSPVTAAGGAISELRRDLIEKGAAANEVALIDMARANLSQLEDMIDALQEVQRAGAGYSGQRELVELSEVLRELLVEVQAEVTRRAVVVHITELPSIYGIRRGLVVALRNLFTNALRHVPSNGTGTIAVGAEDAGAEWRIYVRDNGPGIAAEHQELVFQLFRKAPQQAKSPGLGIGLALVRRTAEQHGGRAWVESDGRNGAMFWLSLPKGLALSKAV
jgi:signal transduction histidine kinase